MRIVHEASLHEFDHGSCFVTLTYRDPIDCTLEQLRAGYHVPSDWSLHKSHFQRFMKRLRHHFPDQTIRFFHCGEYGTRCRHGIELRDMDCVFCNVGRPHYHAVLFNCSFPDLEVYSQNLGEPRYTSKILEDIWKYGFVDVGEVNFESAAYVARYALKKVTGVMADDWYVDKETGDFKQPEYCTMSRGGKGGKGLAYEWYLKFKSDLFPSDEVPVPGSGVFKKVPRYYEELFKEEDPLTHDEIKMLRQKYRDEHAEEYTPERLYAKYKVKKAQTEMLKRTIK